MALCSDLQDFMNVLNFAIDDTMARDMREAVIGELRETIQKKVYDEYPEPKQYERKMDNGGLTDPRNFEVDYDDRIKLLTAYSTRVDWEPTTPYHPKRFVFPVVEEEIWRYDWWKEAKPRPFHEPAEKELVESGLADRVLERGVEKYLGNLVL